MSFENFITDIQEELKDLNQQGLYKNEYPICSEQAANIQVQLSSGTEKMLNFCANNYLGLANDPELKKIAIETTEKYGLGTASVRFICGTMDIHRQFERQIADFLGYEDAISFSSCFAANNGIFSALFNENDAIISADLNHASLIDGIRLCKAKRFFYKFDDMQDLELKIQQALASGSKYRLIVTDGVFSMDGDIAKLPEIVTLAEKYNCFIMVDDSHATGFIGKTGKGTPELFNLGADRIHLISSTLGKALGGAAGGFIVAKKEIIEKLRNKARPYLFSNNISPAIAATSIGALEILKNRKELLKNLTQNTTYFRQAMVEAGFNIREGIHPIVPVMLFDAQKAALLAKKLIEEEKIYVISFSFPVVPKNEARIRVQISAAHTHKDLEMAVEAFKKVGEKLNLI